MPTDERYILEKLLPEYVSLYHIELNSGKYEILRLSANTNARQLYNDIQQVYSNYDEYVKRYADTFILPEDRAEFTDWHNCKKMKERLCQTDKLTYYYHSVSKDGKDSYYEAYAVKEETDTEGFHIFLGYRNIDSILFKEKSIQEKLQNALDEARLSNEIISAIAKTYQYISRIDIQADWFDEISNRDKSSLPFTRSGNITENNKIQCRQMVAEEYQEAFLQFTDIHTLPERMKHEETIVMEYQMQDGTWHKLRFIEKKRDEDGNLTHVLCAIRSISDTKKKEQELIHQMAEARKESALKSRFLSNMSHDIRTPMNGIIGMLDLANQHPDDLELQQTCRDKIMESSRYLMSLVNNILDITKLEADDAMNQEVIFDLAKLLSRANTSKQILATGKNIDYIVDWTRSDMKYRYLIGNPVHLERLLSVIADNAVKFTNPGGSIRVWCDEKPVDDEHILCKFVCSDNGIGMSKEFTEHAFDMFTQEHESSRTTYEGSGLGLTIAKKIVDHMGGSIDIQSKKDIGTTVTLTIPFKIGEPARSERAPEHSAPQTNVSFHGLRALIAEDNELNTEVVRYILEDSGFYTECATDGEKAVNLFAQSVPGYYDVILMDIMMPNMNGWDATRTIRSMNRPDAGSIPIIAMSANAFAEDIINSHVSGINWHLAKPLDKALLLHTLRDCIYKRS